MDLSDNPQKIRAMGKEAKKLSHKNFNSLDNGKKILRIYQRLKCLDN